ncbi:hypothetical protein ADUPG1_002046, partial [Aduncisulcus paluster]
SDSFDDGHYGAHEATALMEAFDGGVCAVCSAGGCLRYVLVDQPSGNQTYDCQANGDGPSAQMFPGMAVEKLFAFRGGQGKSGQLAHENMVRKNFSGKADINADAFLEFIQTVEFFLGTDALDEVYTNILAVNIF